MSTGSKVWWLIYPITIFFGVQFALGMIIGIFAMVSGMAEFSQLAISDPNAFNEQFTAYITEAVQKLLFPTTFAVYVILAAIFVPLYYRDIKKFYIRGEKLEKSSVLTWIAIPLTIFGLAIAFLGVTLALRLDEIFPAMNETGNMMDGQNPFLAFLVLAIFTPIAEEFFFRGILFKRLRCMMNFIPAALISALIFGIGHGTPPQILYTTGLGVIFAYLYEKKGSIWVPVFAHFCLNAMAVIISYAIPNSVIESVPIALFIAIPAIVFAIGLL
jgi:membrane protease YdiL (CAAX protease family)